MTNVAKYIRIFNANPDDDFVTKRMAAIKAIEDGFKKVKDLGLLMALANDLSIALLDHEQLSEFISENVEKALKKQSPSFVTENQTLQMSTCGSIAMLEYLMKTQSISPFITLTVVDVIAISLFSGLSFQKADNNQPKINDLRIALLKEAERICGVSSVVSRERMPIKALGTLVEGGDIATNNKNILQAINPILQALTTNAALDREEIDILWYVLDGTSRILNVKFVDLNVVQSALLRGLEISSLIRRIPTAAHFKLAQHAVHDTKDLNAGELLEELADSMKSLSEYLSQFNQIEKFPHIFPLFSCILNGKAVSANTEIKRSLQDWASRALLEGSLLNLSKFLNDGK